MRRHRWSSPTRRDVDDWHRRGGGGRPSDRTRAGRGDLFNIMYSSGTTGTPKGIALTYGIRAGYCTLFASTWRMTPESVVLHAGSLVFNGAFVTMLPAMYLGSDVHDAAAIRSGSADRDDRAGTGDPHHAGAVADRRAPERADLRPGAAPFAADARVGRRAASARVPRSADRTRCPGAATSSTGSPKGS